MSVLGATGPRLEELLTGHLTVVPRIELVHLALALDGHEYLARLEAAARGALDPFLLVVEGCFFEQPENGYFSGLGERDGPVPVSEWVERLVIRAAAVLAIGTCATWGGVPAAAGNVTGAKSVNDLLGPSFVSRSGLPVVNVPGCPPSGDAFIEVLSYTLLHLDGTVPLDLDGLGRPRWVYAESTPVHPVLQTTGDELDADEQADCPVPRRGWINRLGGCSSVGGSCVGCTRPDFPDTTLPLARGR